MKEIETIEQEFPVRADAGLTTGTDHLMELALSQGTDGVEALRELVRLKREEQDREAARTFAADLSAFQERAPAIGKNAAGAHQARYATLDHIMSRIGGTLARCGFSVTYDEENCDDGRLRVWAILRHRDGHTERASATVSREKASNRMNATQADGSAMQYGRRYALCNVLGLSIGEEDDDGAGAGPAAEPVITDEQVANLIALADEVGVAQPRLLKWAQVSSLGDIRASRYDKMVSGLERQR